jgi:hypothetical protein
MQSPIRVRAELSRRIGLADLLTPQVITSISNSPEECPIALFNPGSVSAPQRRTIEDTCSGLFRLLQVVRASKLSVDL